VIARIVIAPSKRCEDFDDVTFRMIFAQRIYTEIMTSFHRKCRVTFSVDGDIKMDCVNELKTALSADEMAAAWKRRDPEFDGLFVFGVKTTGIFCRPSCPSQPRRENVVFFGNMGEAVAAGYRPCKRCQPELANGKPPEWIAPLLERAQEERISAGGLKRMGIAPERARRWFQRNYGMTFAAWQRGLRLSRAFTEIRRGAALDDVILGNGFESHSGFRSAFAKTFGAAQARRGNTTRVFCKRFRSPT
jgi:methylphosphotriester-DNA--protein-cysteine methyltransferase